MLPQSEANTAVLMNIYDASLNIVDNQTLFTPNFLTYLLTYLLPTGSRRNNVQPYTVLDADGALGCGPISTSGRHFAFLHNTTSFGTARVRSYAASLLDGDPGNLRLGG